MSSKYTVIILNSATLAMKARERLSRAGIGCEQIKLAAGSGCSWGIRVADEHRRLALAELSLAGIPHHTGGAP